MFDVACKDTICALATAPMPSALAIIRVSGPQAAEICARIFRPKKSPQKHFLATLGDIVDDVIPHDRDVVDEGVCILFPDKKSFTGEPSFELNVHGSRVIIQKIIELLQRHGCRLAEPGEFSFRAYLNGKIDLVAAESIYDVIHARSFEAAQAALRNLKGGLANYLEPVRTAIVDVICEIEARLDFPDEDLGEQENERLRRILQDAVEKLTHLLERAQLGTRLTQGARLVLFGRPNVGKSTLLNTLAKEERALVDDTPGTTRDVLEIETIVSGIPVTLVDVAGIRFGDIEKVESKGIERALLEVKKADGILWLQDGSTPENDTELLPFLSDIKVPIIQVFTKSDLCSLPNHSTAVWISAKTGFGLPDLEKSITQLLIDKTPQFGDVLITRNRQKQDILQGQDALTTAITALEHHESGEIVAGELRRAGASFDRLLGKSLNSDVLDLIFSRFCIGK